MLSLEINSGILNICDDVINIIKDGVLVIISDEFVASCDSGVCQREKNFNVFIVKNIPEENNFLYFCKNNIKIAIDINTYNILNYEDITVKKGINIYVEENYKFKRL